MYDNPLPPVVKVTTAAYEHCVARHRSSLEGYGGFKHGGEVHWIRAISRMASDSSTQANPLYILGVHPGWVYRYGTCQQELRGVLQFARGMPEFRRHGGKRHVVLFTDFKVKRHDFDHFTVATQCRHWYPHKPNVIVAPMHTMLHMSGDGHISPSEAQTIRSERGLPRPKSFTFIGQADSRDAYRTRRVLFRALESLKRSHMSVYSYNTKVDQSSSHLHKITNYADLMADATYGIQARGDTPTSNRLYDVLSVGSVPLFLSDTFFYECAPGLGVPWEDFSLLVREPQSESSSAVRQLERELKQLAINADADINRTSQLRQQSLLWADRLLWQSPTALVTETMLHDIEAIV